MPEGYVGTLKVDLQGNIESDVVTFDFVNSLVAGDGILGSPAPQVAQVAETTGAALLTLGTPIISGTQVLVQVTGGTLGAVYSVSCTIQTALGKRRVASGGIKLKASR